MASEPGLLLEEDDESIEAQLRLVEKTLAAIDEEAEHALQHPEISMMTLRRISTLVLQARASLASYGGDSKVRERPRRAPSEPDR